MLAPLYLSPSVGVCAVTGVVEDVSVEVLVLVVGILGPF